MNYIGKKYNNLTVIEYGARDSMGRMRVLCMCDCGNIKSYDMYSVKSGNTKSCGCFRSTIAKNKMTKHGMSNTRLFKTWVQMRQRCSCETSKKYKYYGGRGIFVCNEWEEFNNFYEWSKESGYNDELTIERIDVNGNYCPENCTWIKSELQQRNKRSNVKIEYNGETKILKDWCNDLNLNYKLSSGRLKAGWSVERTFSNNYGIPFNRKTLQRG